VKVSKGARAAIEGAGGSVEVVESKPEEKKEKKEKKTEMAAKPEATPKR
jgi:hypothetical protein